MDPLDYWNMSDPIGQRGITQIRHVTGFLAFWDELRCRHPQLLIDTCASGGRRLDLETVRAPCHCGGAMPRAIRSPNRDIAMASPTGFPSMALGRTRYSLPCTQRHDAQFYACS